MPRFTNPYPQYFFANGEPVLSGKLYFYESNTSTLKTIYDDSEENTPIANPATLNADGSVPNIFYSGSARVKLVASNGVEVFDRDPVGGESQLGNFTLWGAGFIYSLNDLVRANNGEYYRSLQNANQNNDPTATPSNNQYWEQVRFLGLYNAQITYGQGVVTQTSDGQLWYSVVGSNTGNNPETDDGTNWRRVGNEPWFLHTADFTSLINALHFATTSGTAIEVTQPTWEAGAYAVYANSPDSDEVLRILNPSNTIQGKIKTISAGDDLTLDAGQSVHLVAINSDTLKVV